MSTAPDNFETFTSFSPISEVVPTSVDVYWKLPKK